MNLTTIRMVELLSGFRPTMSVKYTGQSANEPRNMHFGSFRDLGLVFRCFRGQRLTRFCVTVVAVDKALQGNREREREPCSNMLCFSTLRNIDLKHIYRLETHDYFRCAYIYTCIYVYIIIYIN